MIAVQLNGKPYQLEKSITVGQLIQQLSCQQQRIAVEINQQICPKAEHATQYIQENDCIEIIGAIGGG